MPPQAQNLPIVWLAMLVSQTIMMLLLFFVVEVDPSRTGEIAWLLLPVALAIGGFGLFGVKRVLKKLDGAGMFLVRWAMLEAMVILGFGAGTLGGPAVIPLGLYALGLMGLMFSRPTEEEYTAWEIDRLA